MDPHGPKHGLEYSAFKNIAGIVPLGRTKKVFDVVNDRRSAIEQPLNHNHRQQKSVD